MTLKFGRQQLKGRVTVTDRGTGEVWVVDISTVDMPALVGGSPETCLFWSDSRGGREGNEVVATYDSWNKAIEGHNTWVNSPKAVAEAMVEAGWRG